MKRLPSLDPARGAARRTAFCRAGRRSGGSEAHHRQAVRQAVPRSGSARHRRAAARSRVSCASIISPRPRASGCRGPTASRSISPSCWPSGWSSSIPALASRRRRSRPRGSRRLSSGKRSAGMSARTDRRRRCQPAGRYARRAAWPEQGLSSGAGRKRSARARGAPRAGAASGGRAGLAQEPAAPGAPVPAARENRSGGRTARSSAAPLHLAQGPTSRRQGGRSRAHSRRMVGQRKRDEARSAIITASRRRTARAIGCFVMRRRSRAAAGGCMASVKHELRRSSGHDAFLVLARRLVGRRIVLGRGAARHQGARHRRSQFAGRHGARA